MEELSFPASRRLKKPAEFNTVYSGNQTRVKGQYFTVLAFSRFHAANEKCMDDLCVGSVFHSRVGVVASKKVSKRAVQRNRIKRLMRESFRARLHPEQFDFVAIARPISAQANNLALAKDLDKLWGRLHQRCDAL